MRRVVDHLVVPAREWLTRDVPALAVDTFRVAVGLLGCAYFVRLWVEFGTISDPWGLIDHALVQDVYPFTRIGLFQAGMPGWPIALAYGVGLLGAGLVLVGHRVRVGAALALLVAASAYRWNFVVMYLDDAVVHLMFFWMLLLPAGRTLTLAGARDPEARAAWAEARVSGVAVRLLLVNVCWIYLLAGAWKLDSELWRSGFGLYASMKVEVARMPDVWTPAHLPFLRWSDWAVMALEPFLPLPMLWSRRQHVRVLSALAFVVFNLFILTTLGIAWAIVGLTATLSLFLAEEVAAGVRRLLRAGTTGSFTGEGGPGHDGHRPAPAARPSWRRSERLALGFLAVLMLATARHVPVFGALNEPAYATLWMVGVAQDYRLFNWIDRVAFQVRTRIDVWPPGASEPSPPPNEAYPRSFRAKLLQAYAHDVRWLLLPDERRFELRLSIVRRHASWFCRHVREPGTRVTVVSTIHPIGPDNLDLARHATLRLAEFTCEPPGSIPAEAGAVPVPEGWPHLQARFVQGLQRLD